MKTEATAQKMAFSPSNAAVVLPQGHRFPMPKYALVRAALLQDGTLNAVLDAPCAPWEAIERIHDAAYLEKLKTATLSPNEIRLLGFPWTPALLERSLRAVGGTFAATEHALVQGLGINLAGGTHHAFADHGEGFCVLNDVAIAAQALMDAGRVCRVAVLDLDVHQGNGTAKLFAQETRVTTISVHGERNYPFRKERSSLDVGLPDGVGDQEYLALLHKTILPALGQAQPDIVFYIAGVDVLANDRFGRFALGTQGVWERDQRVFEWCKQHAVPVVSLMGGGYNRDPNTTVQAHANTVRAALSV